MNRDHLLFTLIGLLFGFIAGYMMHEVMASRQPQRLSVQATSPQSPGVTGFSVPAGSAAGGPALQEITALRQRLESNPDDTAALLRLANLNYDIQDWQRASELYERYLALSPGDADAMTDLGISYRQIGEHQKAIDSFLAAQEVQPDHWQARYNLVIVLAFDLRDQERARLVLDELRTLQPENPEVVRLAAEVEKRAAAG